MTTRYLLFASESENYIFVKKKKVIYTDVKITRRIIRKTGIDFWTSASSAIAIILLDRLTYTRSRLNERYFYVKYGDDGSYTSDGVPYGNVIN